MRAALGRAWLPLFGLAAGLAVAMALAFPGGDDTTQVSPPASEAAIPIAFYDPRTFVESVSQAESAPVAQMPGVRAVIVPHHWVGGYLILRGIRDMAASGDFTRVILVGPDHIGAGSSVVTTTRLAWSTPYGQLQADATAIDALISAGLATDESDVLRHEHSVAGIVHAIKYYMPDAQVVPLVLRHDMSMQQVAGLASALAPLMGEHTVLLAAEDFSHYLSAPDAAANDKEAITALERLDSRTIMSYGDEHLDSPPSIALTIELARLLGATRFELRDDTNSGEVTGTLAPPVTSYITGDYAMP